MENQLQNTIIVSWIGSADIKAMKEWCKENNVDISKKGAIKACPKADQKGKNGPIRTLTDSLNAEIIYLLVSASFKDSAEKVREWVERGTTAKCELELTHVQDPSSYDDVYMAMEKFFQKHWSKAKSSLFNFNINPGTPAMQAIMLYLSQVRYAGGTAWRVVSPEYALNGNQCFEVRLPFRLPVEVWHGELNSSLADEELLHEVLTIYAPVRSVNILLLGETGVGKTYFARRIHDACGGTKDNFVSVNCAELAAGDGNMFRAALFGVKKGAYPDAKESAGAFKLASGGTLFLDEIGEIPLERQAILLSALQEKSFTVVGGPKINVDNVRIIAGTNRDLPQEIRAGRFREDLFFRIAMCPVRLPNLHSIIVSHWDHFQDLVRQLLADLRSEAPELDRDWAIDEQVWPVLRSYTWPGNIRELRHVLLLSCISASARKSNVITDRDIERHLAILSPLLSSSQPSAEQKYRQQDVLAQSVVPKEISAEKKQHAPEVEPLPMAKVSDEKDSADSDKEDFLPSNLKEWLCDKREEFIKKALARCNGSKTQAGRLLGLTYQQVDYFQKNPRGRV